jgi:hypothetical protein
VGALHFRHRHVFGAHHPSARAKANKHYEDAGKGRDPANCERPHRRFSSFGHIPFHELVESAITHACIANTGASSPPLCLSDGNLRDRSYETYPD